MKYQEGVGFEIQSLENVEFVWKFPNMENTQKVGELKIGDKVYISYSKNLLNEKCYVLKYPDGTVSDFLSERDVEIMMGKYNTYLKNRVSVPQANNAEEIFKSNLGKIIYTEVRQDEEEMLKFKGVLLKIFHNIFVLKTEDGNIEMFRYEDLRYLKVLI